MLDFSPSPPVPHPYKVEDVENMLFLSFSFYIANVLFLLSLSIFLSDPYFVRIEKIRYSLSLSLSLSMGSCKC